MIGRILVIMLALVAAPATAQDDPPAPPAPVDPSVERAQDGKSLPAALERKEPDAAIGHEKLTEGPHAMGLTVEVLAPATANLHKPTTFKIVVKNNGTHPALGVVVRDELPESLKYISSNPKTDPAGPVLTWRIDALKPGEERTFEVKAEPIQKGPLTHFATVSALGGSKSRTVVREPKLRVIAKADVDRELRGRQVSFKITVVNDGDSPATDVKLLAHLTKGLKNSKGEDLELRFRDAFGKGTLGPGEQQTIDLVATADKVGDQAVSVEATSPDVTPVAADVSAKAELRLKVIEPQLKVTFKGPSGPRAPGSVVKYTLTVKNEGTAPAERVKIAAWLPAGCRIADHGGGRYTENERQLYWPGGTMEPNGEPKVCTFTVVMGKPGFYDFEYKAEDATGATQKGDLSKTEVVGQPKLKITINELKQYLDVGDETTYEITIRNIGSADARKLKVNAALSDQFEAVQIAGVEGEGKFDQATKRSIEWPVMESLPFNSSDEEVLTLRVKAVKPGVGTCKVTLTFDGLDGKVFEETAVTKVNDPGKD